MDSVRDLKLSTVRQEEKIELQKEKLEIQERKMELLNRRALFSTNSEHDVGDRILTAVDDDTSDYVTNFVPNIGDYSCLDLCSHITSAMLQPIGTGKEEDRIINRPFHQILLRLVTPSTLILTTGKCQLIDARGREQRADMILVSEAALGQEWPNVQSMLEGKQNLLDLSQWKTVLGQAMRRAEAILTMQPWRQFTVVVMYDMFRVAFFRLTRNYEFSFSKPILCLERTPEGVALRDGLNQLVFYLTHPSEVGYSPCPVKLISARGFPIHLQNTICARSQNKAVFKVTNDELNCSVLKAFRSCESASVELHILKQLQAVKGVSTLISDLLDVQLQDINGAEVSWFGFCTMPYCNVLTPALASEAVIKSFANILVDAYQRGYVNNDISPDNLLVHEFDGELQAIIGDWGLATSEGVNIGCQGKFYL